MKEIIDTAYQISDTTFVVNTIKIISEINNESFINAQNIIALCAILISIVALGISVRYNRETLKLTKEQNILSVKPLLTIKFHKDYNTGIFKLELLNNGLGPALIKDIIFELGDTKNENLLCIIESSNRINKVAETLHEYPNNVTANINNYWLDEKTSLILSSSKIINKSTSNLDNLFMEMSNILINVEYFDIYNNKNHLNENITKIWQQ